MDNKKNREKLLSYIPIAEFITQMNGPRTEALIHDVSDYKHSIIYISPKNITGRKVGGQLTDYAIKLIDSKIYETTDFVVNYLGRSAHENLILRSSTYFIKEGGTLIGLLCINIDITEQMRAAEIFEKSLLIDRNGLDSDQVTETFTASTEDMISKVVLKKTAHLGNRKLSADENRQIIRELDSLDVFMVRGSIAMVSGQLKVSEQTVYRYLQELKK